MYVSDSLKLVWVRVPKVGSTSYYNATEKTAKWQLVGEDHGALLQDKVPEGYRTLLVIREPFAWVESFYAMCVRAPIHWTEYVEDECVELSDKTLDRFLEKLKVTPFSWAQNVDLVKRIEECKSIGRENITENKPTIDWTDKAKELVHRRLARELSYY